MTEDVTSIAIAGSSKRIVKDAFREVGIDTQCWPGKTQETIFFLRAPYGGCSDDTPATRRMAAVTPEAAAEFIEFWSNQIQLVKDYVANGCNPNTHEWKAVMEEPARVVLKDDTVHIRGKTADGDIKTASFPVADLRTLWSRWDLVTCALVKFDPPPTPEEWQVLEGVATTPAAKNGLSETRQAISRTVKV